MWKDLRLAARNLVRSPGFSLVAILVLAVGIGGLTPTFSLIEAYLLRPLPFAEPGQLVHLWGTHERRGLRMLRVSLPELRDWQRQSESFEGLAAFNYTSEDLTGGDRPERISAGRVSANVFEVLGVPPELGSGFQAGDDQPGADPVVVLSHAFWQRRFGEDPEVLGRTLELNRRTYTVVGVMPPDLIFPLPTTELWLPWTLDEAQMPRGRDLLQVVGRLRPGVTRAEAQREMSAVASRLAQVYPDTQRDRGVTLVELRSALNFAHEIFQVLAAILLPANFLVLLIACANVSSLLLARGLERRREVAIRAALGASRRRLVRQLLAESLILAGVGGGLGALLSMWTTDGLARIIPSDLYRVGELSLDGRALLFTLGISCVAALLVGLLPALRTSEVALAESLKEAGAALSASRRSLRLQRHLVVGQVAMAVLLLVCTALIVRSFRALERVDPGFEAAGVLTLTLSLPEDTYPAAPRVVELQRRVLQEVAAVPGALGAAAANHLPLNHETQSRELTDLPAAVAGEVVQALQVVVSPGYFQVLGVPVLEGRELDAGDTAEAPGVVVINQTLAQRLWPDGGAVGQRLGLDGADAPVRVVGVVGDTKHQDLAAPDQPQIYLPLAQSPRRYFRLLVRTAGDPLASVGAVREAVWRIDPTLPLTEIRPLQEVVSEFLLPQQSMAAGLAGMACTAILLGCAGIYGLMAFFVSVRRHEMGVRMALGARRREVVAQIVAGGLRLTAIGLGVGLLAALGLSHLLRGVLYGVGTLDPLTFLLVPLLVAVLALWACYLPARRAARVDPMEALRVE